MALTEHVDGQTETWIQDIVVALLHGLQRQKVSVLECGGFLGHTSVRLAQAVALWGGHLTVAEYDPEVPERAQQIDDRITQLGLMPGLWTVRHEDALAVIRSLPDESLDFVYLDDDHQHAHVDAELQALFPKMRSGGIICGHDVYGTTDLQQEFKHYGGYALDLPKLGPAGGLGILQCP